MKVVHVGAYPPPPGGIASHIQRLDRLCRESGMLSVVIDGYGGGRAPVPPGIEVVRLGGRRPQKLACLVWRLQSERADIVHIHLSSMSNFLWGAGPILLATRHSKRIATLHGGNFIHSFESLPALVRRYLQSVFTKFDYLITVNPEQREYLLTKIGVEPNRVSVIPAFLPPPVDDATRNFEPLATSLRAFCDRFDHVALVTGFVRPYYGFHTAIQAFDSLTDLSVGLVVHFYTSIDRRYKRTIEALADERTNVFISEMEMNEGQMIDLLGLVRVFIRATSVDGDSIALREAAYLGRQIVATDCVPRPEGCLLYTFGDRSALSQLVREALSDANIGLVRDVDSDYGPRVLNIYRKVLVAE